jgi:hypothetical protein
MCHIDLIGIGAPKRGSTLVSSQLEAYPQIGLVPAKEVCYFADTDGWPGVTLRVATSRFKPQFAFHRMRIIAFRLRDVRLQSRSNDLMASATLLVMSAVPSRHRKPLVHNADFAVHTRYLF